MKLACNGQLPPWPPSTSLAASLYPNSAACATSEIACVGDESPKCACDALHASWGVENASYRDMDSSVPMSNNQMFDGNDFRDHAQCTPPEGATLAQAASSAAMDVVPVHDEYPEAGEIQSQPVMYQSSGGGSCKVRYEAGSLSEVDESKVAREPRVDETLQHPAQSSSTSLQQSLKSISALGSDCASRKDDDEKDGITDTRLEVVRHPLLSSKFWSKCQAGTSRLGVLYC
jgi:hypothetical protein